MPVDATARASSTSFSVGGIPSTGLRRAFTVDETSSSNTRKRPSLAPQHTSSFDGLPHSSSPSYPTAAASPPQRRPSSTYSLGEARDIISPKATGGGDLTPHEPSSLASLSLASALLPALAGVLFQNGGALVTDLMLLGLAGIFLNWSVTQPWNWYHAAQEVRIKNEESAESAIEEDSEVEGPSYVSTSSSQKLDRVPEEDKDESASNDDGDDDYATPRSSTPALAPEADQKQKPTTSPKCSMTAEQKSAVRELYLYEAIALVSCFSLPLVAAYFLHAIRSQLSRPSEGLVSNYNLTIFCLASELRVFSHVFKLVQCRTLHLQRIVHKYPHELPPASASPRLKQLDEVLKRLDRLETSGATATTTTTTTTPQARNDPVASTADKWKQEAAMVQQLRASMQPELDALNRAVRRYEKKSTLLEMQVQSRFGAVEARLDDSIALAAAAAKNSALHNNDGNGIISWIMDMAIRAILWHANALLRIALLPLDAAKGFVNVAKGRKQSPPSARTVKRDSISNSSGGRVTAATATMARHSERSGGGVPSRVSRR
ncbi:hypothetical protein GMORB2_2214 [Geosmithia morbida]|uniref:Uncharacterized protein n=1 Tax=Geosmithia morbida TaxID=1094350 RepID=A0A9P4YSZ3_9HYPO|nr:uncharacterized protein GMORB2_2214 [Geosmithia morbida]KAF4121252.1 hypothetical protein GMORB2_2214 [Geosmithia morbida]